MRFANCESCNKLKATICFLVFYTSPGIQQKHSLLLLKRNQTVLQDYALMPTCSENN